jgi:TetR/AcrR family transcriptional regulator, transcriptional repressor for nem operon
MASRGETKELIIKTASGLVQIRGFTAVSFGDIADALDVKAPAIHYHFKTKSDLGLALVERYRSRYRAWMRDAVAEQRPATQQLQGYIRIAARFSEGGKVCPVGILTSEYAAIPTDMQPAVRDMANELLEWVTDIVNAGAATGEFAVSGDPRDVAALIVAGVQGALQTSRAVGRPVFEGVVRQVQVLLSSAPIEPLWHLQAA